MRHIPILAKFLLLIGIFGAFSIAVAIFATSTMASIDTSYRRLDSHQAQAALRLARANRALYAVHLGIDEILMATTADQKAYADKVFDRARQDLTSFIEEAAGFAADPATAAGIRELGSKSVGGVIAGCQPTLDLAQRAATSDERLTARARYYAECQQQFDAVSADIIAKTVAVDDQVMQAGLVLSQTTQTSIKLTLGLILGGLAIVLLGGVVAIRHWLVLPIRSLATTMQRLSAGDLEAEIDGGARRDEIGAMTRSVQLFKDSGLEKRTLAAEAETMRAAAEAERARNDAAAAEAAKKQSNVVESLASGLGKLSAGNLEFRLTTQFAPEYERLRGDYNAAMTTLQETISKVAASTDTIASGSNELTQASDDLSRRTEQQAASLEETAAALDEITATVGKTATGATTALSVAAAAKSDAEQSGTVVGDAVKAMGEIEDSSRQIGQIIGVIDEIAFQTNLLALNAGVEAARAGDAGRGFAVVASEVRALAQRSAEAAKEIKALIHSSNEQVGRGVKLVGVTGEALQRIVKQVNDVHAAIVEIAASAQEQATGLHQVNTAVNQMDQVTQQNAAMVEQSTAASHSLSQETAELVRLTTRFQIGATQQGEKQVVNKLLAAAHSKPVRPRAAPAPVKMVTTTASHGGGAVRKPEMATEQDWEEF